MQFTPEQLDEAKRLIAIAEEAERGTARQLAVIEAYDSLIRFVQLMLPDIRDPLNPDKSRYIVKPFHLLIAEVLERVAAGEVLRVILNLPPRHGKSEITSRKFPPWIVGRDPYLHVMFATYNEDFALDFGRSVRETMQSPAYQEVFPEVQLRKGSQSASQLVTTEGGVLNFVGRGSSITGRGADLLIIDDPLKDSEEADSPTIREKLWQWFTKTAMTRLMHDGVPVILIQTRWHEDDLVGRLTDPQNPCYDVEEAKKWVVIDLPALAGEDDLLGRPPGEPLWPEKFGATYLKGVKRLNKRGFSALYQQRPTPEEGDFFQSKYIVTYGPDDLPAKLRIYAASDHAVSEQQRADKTCLLLGGVDDNANLWILPDCFWRREKTDVVVEAMIDLMARHNPLLWTAEKGHISGSIGPFLRKRMLEREVFCAVHEATAVADKQTRAQAIQGRMSMGKVRFPRYAPWFVEAESELLKFPYAVHDDFVDALAWLGRGLPSQVNAGPAVPEKPKIVPFTGRWLKYYERQEKRRQRANRSLGG